MKANWRPFFGVHGGALLAVALLLTACNSVTSTTPWFSQSDAAGAPPLRQGVWRLLQQTGKPCQVDERKPITTWPDCAMGLVVREGDVLGLDTKDGKRIWSSLPDVFAAGDPRILQVSDDPDAKSYDYIGVDGVRLDDGGRAVAISGWIVTCSPPSTSPSGGIPADFPGLTPISGSSNCTAQSLDALRAAAKSSEPPPSDAVQAHWVREGYR